MKTTLRLAALAAGISVAALGGAHAQGTGVLSKAVGGYTFDDAAKEAAGTKDFNSKDGKLTFAIVTHTAGNGFFDPTYVGAKVAADAFGINLVMLGSEAPVDDIPRELEILNQVAQDPTIDGLILTTPQSGAYDDLVKKLEAKGIPVATTNSFDPQHLRPLRHQPHRPGLGGGGDRRRGARQMPDRQGARGRLGDLPVDDHARQCGGQPPRHRRVRGDRQGAQRRRRARRTSRSTPGPKNIGIDVDKDNIVGSIVCLIESRGDVVGAFAANGFVTPALGDAVAQLKINDKVCAFGFDLGPKQQEQIRTGALSARSASSPSCRASGR